LTLISFAVLRVWYVTRDAHLATLSPSLVCCFPISHTPFLLCLFSFFVVPQFFTFFYSLPSNHKETMTVQREKNNVHHHQYKSNSSRDGFFMHRT
jgi:hypothetical protein